MVEMTATNASSFVRVQKTCGMDCTEFVPSVWETTLKGTISSRSLTATKSAWGMAYDGYRTKALMMRTWTH